MQHNPHNSKQKEGRNSEQSVPNPTKERAREARRAGKTQAWRREDTNPKQHTMGGQHNKEKVKRSEKRGCPQQRGQVRENNTRAQEHKSRGGENRAKTKAREKRHPRAPLQ